MDSIFHGSLNAPGGRLRAWVDALFVDHGVIRLAWANRGTVVPGRLYRSNQPGPARLARDARRYGLRSVLNLRGRTGNGADALEREAAARLGLRFMDLPLRSRVAPPPALLLALVAALEDAEPPLLLHCKSGADRAGFAAAVYLLLHGASAATARRQLTLRHGHLAHSRAGVLGAVLAAFAARADQAQGFADWVRNDYQPEALAAHFRPRPLANWLNERLLRRE